MQVEYEERKKNFGYNKNNEETKRRERGRNNVRAVARMFVGCMKNDAFHVRGTTTNRVEKK